MCCCAARGISQARVVPGVAGPVIPEERTNAGRSINEALTAFRESVNQPHTVFSPDHWLLPKLGRLQRLLSEPITQQQAEALLDVLYQRHFLEELIEWLESRRPESWADFLTYQANLKQEELRKRAEDLQHRADERERRRAAGLDPYFDFKLSDEFFPKISDTCPYCGSSEWKPIAYGSRSSSSRHSGSMPEPCSTIPNEPAFVWNTVSFAKRNNGISLCSARAAWW